MFLETIVASRVCLRMCSYYVGGAQGESSNNGLEKVKCIDLLSRLESWIE